MMAKIPSCDKDGLKKGPWTPEEDQKLIDYIKKHGHGRWRTLPKNAGLKRCGKSCRLRWTNYLRPDIKRGRFSFEEEETIIQLHSVLGNKWSAIAARLPGRTDNEIKNFWNTHIRKRLLKMGIDPITHAPRLDLLELSSLLSSSLYNPSSSLMNQNPNYLLGNMGPLVSQNLLNLATTLLSCQPKSGTSNSATTLGFVPQNNAQENLALEHALQNQPQPFYQNQFQNPTIRDEIQTCTTSTTSNSHIVPYLNETQLIQAKMDQLSQTLMTSYSTIATTSTNYHNNISSTTTWQNNAQGDQALITTPSESFIANNIASTNTGFPDSTQSSPIINYSMKNSQAFVSGNSTDNIANMSFSSLLSTPSSSPYANYSCSTNTSQENERDSLCSNMFMYDIANFAL